MPWSIIDFRSKAGTGLSGQDHCEMDINKRGRVLNIAHRGASGHAPENTLASFCKAIEIGADMIEFDVHRSVDGHLIVVHDRRLTRVGEKRWAVDMMTLEELKTIDVGSWFGKGYAGERIPTLRDILKLTRGKIELNLEIKSGGSSYDLIEKPIIGLLREYGMLDKTLVSSFDYTYLENIRKAEKSARIGLLVDKGGFKAGLNKALSLYGEAINITDKILSKKVIEMAKAEGLKLYVYTVDDVADMERYIKMGVDGIFTNYPDRLGRLLSAFC